MGFCQFVDGLPGFGLIGVVVESDRHEQVFDFPMIELQFFYSLIGRFHALEIVQDLSDRDLSRGQVFGIEEFIEVILQREIGISLLASPDFPQVRPSEKECSSRVEQCLIRTPDQNQPVLPIRGVKGHETLVFAQIIEGDPFF